MAERWKPILGFAGCYSVSDSGQCARTMTYGGHPKWKLIAERIKRDGYVRFHLCKDGHRSDKLAHRLIWEAFNGPIPKGLEINHKNSIRSDNRLVNLELMTRSENIAYGFSANARPAPNNPSPGSRNGGAKLTEADIPNIRRLLRDGVYQYEIAKLYGVSQRTISRIALGVGWRHV